MVHLIGCYGSDRNSRWLGVEVPPHPDPAIAALLVADELPDADAFAAAPSTAVGELAVMGRWDLVEAALAHGLPPDGPAPTALHHAAGRGLATIVERLLEAGADPTVEDPTFHSTPGGWAEFLRHPEVAARLHAAADAAAATAD